MEKLYQFLNDPKSYRHKVDDLKIIETHISIVAITSLYVYKFKKPVNFGWVDFSTLEKRKFYCENEVELNRRLCDNIYVGVQPLYNQDGHLNFEDGEIIDYCVLMNRIPDQLFLTHYFVDKFANQQPESKIGPDFPYTAITDRLVHFYKKSAPLSIEPPTYFTSIKQPVIENLPPFVNYHNAISVEVLSLLSFFFELCFERLGDILIKRLAEGKVVDCHGDLHLEHIVLPASNNDSVCFYDCIEFNDSFRQIDIACDVAFLCMDLDFRGYRSISSNLSHKLIAQLSDASFEQVQPFFRAYRSCVRAKVNSLTALDSHVCEIQREESIQKSKRYIQLGLRYAVAGTKPLAIIVMGRIASGKSAFARLAASYLGVNAKSSDRIRKELAGLPPLQETPVDRKPEVYTIEMTNQTYAEMLNRSLVDIDNFGVAVLDATFSSKNRRQSAIRFFNDVNIDILFVEITAKDNVRRERLKVREHRPNTSDARLADLTFIDKTYFAPDELSTDQLIQVDSSNGTKEETAQRTFQQLIRKNLNSILNSQKIG
ncbi:MAG: AAA family ATPase [Leptonema sp. (in: Bacteria)]|nr:AAA family ATPase [Leptonema sp. (in: bacteria)]